MCRAVPTRKTRAREARPRAWVTRAFGVREVRRSRQDYLVGRLAHRRTTGAQGHNSPPPEHVSRRLQFVDSGAEPLEFDAATLRLPTSSLQVTTPPIVDFATECCRRGINDGPVYYPDDLNCAQGHNSPPPEHVSRRLQFVDSGAEPLEFDAATLRLPTSSLQVTTPPIVDFATECCRRGINDGPVYYPDDLNCRPNVLLIHLV
ncbi:hypothetical protein HPB51_011043 [Rhipicephalus microplus]|uniref:Uncharacterized protein n=1 Tax=Rhipicephalus microplus TaxID=6941 RepID=A0A9J6EH58_RHIMP|nr:hypothetical protein HPB51_011043 [Rhipicephalus microplus]